MMIRDPVIWLRYSFYKSEMIPRCNDIQDTFYMPTLHQFKYEIEDGYRADGSPVRIGYDEQRFPGYSWSGYGAYSELQDEVMWAK